MRLSSFSLCVALLIPAAAQAGDPGTTIRRCLLSASERHNVPADVLVLIYEVEGGTLGKVSHNENGTVDIGPFQINQIWVPEMADRWGLSQKIARHLLLTQFCANADAAAWILGRNLEEVHGDIWEAVGRYHSRTPHLKRRYLETLYQKLKIILGKRRHG